MASNKSTGALPLSIRSTAECIGRLGLLNGDFKGRDTGLHYFRQSAAKLAEYVLQSTKDALPKIGYDQRWITLTVPWSCPVPNGGCRRPRCTGRCARTGCIYAQLVSAEDEAAQYCREKKLSHLLGIDSTSSVDLLVLLACAFVDIGYRVHLQGLVVQGTWCIVRKWFYHQRRDDGTLSRGSNLLPDKRLNIERLKSTMR